MTRTEDDLRAGLMLVEPPPGAEERLAAQIRRLATAPARRSVRRLAPVLGIASAVAVILAVAVLVALLRPAPGWRRGPATSDVPTQGAPSVPSSQPPPNPTPGNPTPTGAQPTSPPAATGDADVAVLRALVPLLPRPGAIGSVEASDQPGTTVARFTYDDGQGIAAMTLALSTSGVAACGQGVPLGYTCTGLADGTELLAFQGLEVPSLPTGSTRWEVRAHRPDGLYVDLLEWNSSAEKGQPVSRATPPFAIDELTAIVTDPVWSTSMMQDPGALTPFSAPPGAVGQPASTDAAEYLQSVLPRPGQITDVQETANSTQAQASFVYDDGSGPAYLSVTLRQVDLSGHPGIGMCDGNWPGYETCVLQPDGSGFASYLINDSTQPSVRKAFAGLYRPDGLTIEITERSAAGPTGGPATRPEVPFTLGELRAAVLAPGWQV